MLLWRRFLDNKVLLSCGKAFECSEPGWFRIIFADKTHRLQLGEWCFLLFFLSQEFLQHCFLFSLVLNLCCYYYPCLLRFSSFPFHAPVFLDLTDLGTLVA